MGRKKYNIINANKTWKTKQDTTLSDSDIDRIEKIVKDALVTQAEAEKKEEIESGNGIRGIAYFLQEILTVIFYLIADLLFTLGILGKNRGMKVFGIVILLGMIFLELISWLFIHENELFSEGKITKIKVDKLYKWLFRGKLSAAILLLVPFIYSVLPKVCEFVNNVVAFDMGGAFNVFISYIHDGFVYFMIVIFVVVVSIFETQRSVDLRTIGKTWIYNGLAMLIAVVSLIWSFITASFN